MHSLASGLQPFAQNFHSDVAATFLRWKRLVSGAVFGVVSGAVSGFVSGSGVVFGAVSGFVSGDAPGQLR